MEKLEELSVLSFDDFRLEHEDEFGKREEMDYDPVAKKYIGRPAPMKGGVVYVLKEDSFDDEDDYDDEDFDDEDYDDDDFDDED